MSAAPRPELAPPVPLPNAADLAMLTGFAGIPEDLQGALAIALLRRELVRLYLCLASMTTLLGQMDPINKITAVNLFRKAAAEEES